MTTLVDVADATTLSIEPDPEDFSTEGIAFGLTVATQDSTGTVPGALALGRSGVLDQIKVGIERDSYVEWTTAGAPQVVIYVRDPLREILNSGIFDYSVSTSIDDVAWHLVHVDYDDESRRIVLTFEHEIASELRQHTKPIKASRGSVTRAQFIYRMMGEIGTDVRFVCPQLTVKQRIAAPKPDQTASAAAKRRKAKAGFASGTRITAQGVTLTPEQLRLAARALAVAADEKAGPLATLALMCAAGGESTFSLVTNSIGYGGLLGGDVSAHYSYFSADDVEGMTRSFLRGGNGYQGGGAMKLARQHPDWTPGHVALVVEGSRSNFGSEAEAEGHYEKWRPVGQALIRAYTGGGSGPTFATGGGGSYWKKYEFTRGVPGVTHEDSLGASIRLSNEVRWRFFIVGKRTVYYLTDDDLLKLPPRFALTASSPGYVNVSFGIEVGGRYVVRHGQKTARPSEATLTVRADRMAVHPGMSIVLAQGDSEGFGPGGGQWLVDSTKRGLFDSETECNLRRGQRPLPEPRSELVQRAKAKAGKVDPSSYNPPPGHGVGEFAVLMKGLTFAGPDQGIDFTGSGTIYAPCDLRITRIARPGSADTTSWPGGHLIVGEILSNHPPSPYRFMYFAEAIVPVSGLRVGQTLSAGDAVASLNSPYPGTEIGFAQNGHGDAYGTTSDGKAGGGTPVHGNAIRTWIAGLSRASRRSGRSQLPISTTNTRRPV